MVRCSVLHCKSDSLMKIAGLSFHTFPNKPEIRNMWIAATNRPNWAPKTNSRICSQHFDSNRLIEKACKTYLYPDAVPNTVAGNRGSAMIIKSSEATSTETLEGSSKTVKSYSSPEFSPRTLKRKWQNDQEISKQRLKKLKALREKSRRLTKKVADLEHREVFTNGNEIKVFCPKCNTEVSHTAEGIQQDQTKILISKVYRYFEQEYEELKMIYGHLDLTPLSKFCQRTALATGVSEAMLMRVLKEEERRNEERQQEPQKERAARKRRRQPTHNSSEEDSSDDNVEDIEQPSPPEETLVVKLEPPEYNIVEPEIFVPAAMKLEPSDSDACIEEPEIFVPAVKVEPSDDDTNKEQTDPIALEMKPETHDDKDDTTDATPASEISADTKRKAKKTPRLSDETSVLSCLPGEVEIKIEEEFS